MNLENSRSTGLIGLIRNLLSERSRNIFNKIFDVLAIVTMIVGLVFLFFVNMMVDITIDGTHYDGFSLMPLFSMFRFNVFYLLGVIFSACSIILLIISAYFNFFKRDKKVIPIIIDVFDVLFYAAAITMVFISLSRYLYIRWAIIVAGILVSCSCLFVLLKLGLLVASKLFKILFGE